MPTTTTIEIPSSAAWYVKTGLDRALRLTRHQIEQTEKRIASLKTKHVALQNIDPTEKAFKDIEFVTEFIKEAEGIRDYYAQWLNEATEIYKTLPKEIRPFDLGDSE